MPNSGSVTDIMERAVIDMERRRRKAKKKALKQSGRAKSALPGGEGGAQSKSTQSYQSPYRYTYTKPSPPKPRNTRPIDPNDPVGVTIREVLSKLLPLRREHDSHGEWAACQFLKDSGFIPIAVGEEVIAYIAGDPFATTCIMGHIDSVHRGRREQMNQSVERNLEGIWSLAGQGDCLGADDGAGVAAIFALRDARPDLCYIIHRGEERGGIGARAIQGLPDVLGFNIVVSLDRRGYDDIIKHQSGGAGCSDKFVDWLAAGLNAHNPDSGYVWSEGVGSYTDSASYMGAVPECTNLSVGYFGAHTSSETLDEGFLIELTHALIGLNFDEAPVVRDPKAMERRWANNTTYPYEQMADWEWDSGSYRQSDHERYGGMDLEASEIEYKSLDEMAIMAQLTHLVNSYPAEVAQVLRDYGFNADDLRQEIKSTHYDGS